MKPNVVEPKKDNLLAKVRIISDSPGRLRMRIMDKRIDRPFMEHIVETIGTWPGIERVEASPITRTILILFDGTSDRIWQKGEDDQLFIRIPSAQPAPSSMPRRKVSHAPTHHFENDIGGLVGATLLGLAALQATRGKFLPAGLTLIFQASEFLKTRHRPLSRAQIEPLSEGL